MPGKVRPIRSQFDGSRHGYIISVIEVIDIGKGKIMASRGHVLFSVTYKALMFRPMINEVLDCIVTTIHQVRAPLPQLIDAARNFRRGWPCPSVHRPWGSVLMAWLTSQEIPDMAYDGSSQPPCFAMADEVGDSAWLTCRR